MYDDFARWWPVLSAPEDYEEDAGLHREALQASGVSLLKTLL